MRYEVVKCVIEFIGHIWMPKIVVAQVKELSGCDLENLGEWTRENVERWLNLNSGDFQDIIDFRADFSDNRFEKDWESDWEIEDSEWTFFDCMHGEQEIKGE